MKKWTSEIVQIAWDGHEAVGMLHQNGQTKFYRVSPAQKEFVSDLLGVDDNPEKEI